MSLGYNRVGHGENTKVSHEGRAIVIDMRHPDLFSIEFQFLKNRAVFIVFNQQNAVTKICG